MEYHDLQVGKLIEVRTAPRHDVREDEIYYVVHRVAIGNAQWYHHGVVLADALDVVSCGMGKLQSRIRDELGGAPAIVTPVFLRNLMAQDHDVIDSAARQDISDEIAKLRRGGQEERFVVFGIIGENRITLVDVDAVDALQAAADVATSVREQFNTGFLPLDVSFALPVADELDRHFLKASAHIRSMLEVSPVYVH